MSQKFNIKKLSDNVINQIKAGEVIERPFNVVKELLENSLDASATSIKVELLDGGKRLIQISDNGFGIPKIEVPTAIERHTTSKLNQFEELENIKSFGFRGEALASIASVSKLIIKTRFQSDPMGSETIFENAVPIQVKDLTMNIGTTIAVKDIFYNVPPRLKFLRSTATEFSLIQEFLYAKSIAFPHVSFQFIHNGRTVFDYKSKNLQKERFEDVMGADASNYAYINFERGHFRVFGFCILPEKIKLSQNSMIIFVNGRFVKDKLIRSSIYMGYRGLLMKGVTPSSILFINLDPKMIDINAHPSKIEVRFFDPLSVQDFITRSIEDVLKSKLNESLQKPIPDNNIQLYSPNYPSDRLHYNHAIQHAKIIPNILFTPPIQRGFFANAKFLNQFAQCYLIFQNELELWFIDQHAFHERILFEEIQSAHKTKQIAKQMLLNPTLIPMNEFISHVYEEHAQLIQNLGFEIEILKNNHIAIHSIPSFLNQRHLETTWTHLIQKLCQQKAIDTDILYHDCFSTIACHSAIRSGEILSSDFIQKLINRADDVDFFAHCPHGRPVVRKFSKNDVARWFERI